MAEYIEREAVVKLLKAACEECRETCEEFDGFYADCNQCIMHSVVNGVPSIPAADVVPVVRCGECMWSDNYGLELMCQKHSGITKSKLGEDIHFVEWHSKYFFCSDGERRDAK